MNRFGSILTAALVWLTAFVGSAHAVTPDEMLKDPALESRAREISQTLRCVVCQNQSIDDSNAPLAKDLRVLVRERLSAGDTDAQTIGYIVARYGNFVLLRPPVQTNTLLLWFGPALMLALAAYGLMRTLKRQAQPNAATDTAPLSKADEKLIAGLLGEPDQPAAPQTNTRRKPA